MNLHGTLCQYSQLTRAVFFPARYVHWLFLLTLAVVVTGSVLAFFGHRMTLMVGVGINLILIMVSGMLVPGQMLALRSSKQFQYLADLRNKLFVIVMVFWLLASLLISVTLLFINPKIFSFHLTFAVATMCFSVVAVVFVLVGIYMRVAQGAVPFFIWIIFFSAKNTNIFSSVHPSYFWSITIVLWLGFYLWWRRWSPKNYLVNFMTLSAIEMQKQQLVAIHSVTNIFSAVPKTLSGSLLIGSSDGNKSWFKRELAHLTFFFMVLMCMFLWTKKMPEGAASALVTICFFVFICVRSGIIFQALYRNVYLLWMHSGYTRAGIFKYIEQGYFLSAAAFILPSVSILALANDYFFGGLIEPFYGRYALLIGILVISASFYLGLLIYVKSSASLVFLNWIAPIINLIFVGLMVYLNILWGPGVSHDHSDYLWFAGLLLMINLMGRLWAKSRWEKVNFYRVKN